MLSRSGDSIQAVYDSDQATACMLSRSGDSMQAVYDSDQATACMLSRSVCMLSRSACILSAASGDRTECCRYSDHRHAAVTANFEMRQ
jgi:hypothetical protein